MTNLKSYQNFTRLLLYLYVFVSTDNGGMRESLRAYKKQLGVNGEASLPGLSKYTSEQVTISPLCRRFKKLDHFFCSIIFPNRKTVQLFGDVVLNNRALSSSSCPTRGFGVRQRRLELSLDNL